MTTEARKAWADLAIEEVRRTCRFVLEPRWRESLAEAAHAAAEAAEGDANDVYAAAWRAAKKVLKEYQLQTYGQIITQFGPAASSVWP